MGEHMEKENYRFATASDGKLILQFIRELADYEKMLPEVVATEELLREWIESQRTCRNPKKMQAQVVAKTSRIQ